MIRKKANAIVIYPTINEKYWNNYKHNDKPTIKKYASSLSMLHGYADMMRPNDLISSLIDDNDVKTVTHFDPNNYIYSHVSIVASVDLCRDNHTITPQTAKYINDNGDAWERELLKLTYKSFIGGFNFYEHNQNPAEKVGWVIDAVARDIKESIIVDILIATDKANIELCQRILDKDIKTVSMGCVCKFCICSVCGKVLVDSNDYCEHVLYQKLKPYISPFGDTITAELCGSKDDPTSVVFEEASWVEVPAYKDAVLHNILANSVPKSEKAIELLKFAKCTSEYCSNFNYDSIPKEMRETVKERVGIQKAASKRCSCEDYRMEIIKELLKK